MDLCWLTNLKIKAEIQHNVLLTSNLQSSQVRKVKLFVKKYYVILVLDLL